MVRRQFNLLGCRVFTPPGGLQTLPVWPFEILHGTLLGNVNRDHISSKFAPPPISLIGQCRELQGELEAEMKKAAASQDFEQAAECGISGHLKRNAANGENRACFLTRYRLRLAPRSRYRRPRHRACFAGHAGPHRGFRRFEHQRHICGGVHGDFSRWPSGPSNYRRSPHEVRSGPDDFACMAETVRRPLRSACPTGDPNSEKEAAWRIVPDLIVIDGGKGQLNAAVAELAKLVLERIPIIALQEFEEIYGRAKPNRCVCHTSLAH